MPGHQTRQTSASEAPLRSLAVVTPWAPDRTGIADYVMGLVEALRTDVDEVVVYSGADRPCPGVRPLTELLGRADDHEVIVYHLGNNSRFHLPYVEMLARTGGVVHLHDLALHHLFQTHAARHRADRYLEILETWEGPEARAEGSAALVGPDTGAWTLRSALRLPLCEEVLQYADRVLVHSRFAADELARRLPHLVVEVIPQLYPWAVSDADDRSSNGGSDDRVVDSRAGTVELVALGDVTTHKHLDLVFDALGLLPDANVRLRLLGEVDDACRGVVDRARLLLGDVLVVEGRVDDATYRAAVRHADLIINLRRHTMGEVSAVAMQAVQVGVPLLVTDHGAYRELPDSALAVDPDTSATDLAAVLGRFIDDPAWRAELRGRAAVARSRLPATEDVTRRYVNALRRARRWRRRRPFSVAVLRPFDPAMTLLGGDVTEVQEGRARAWSVREPLMWAFDAEANESSIVWLALSVADPGRWVNDNGPVFVRLDGREAEAVDVVRLDDELVVRAVIRSVSPGSRHVAELRMPTREDDRHNEPDPIAARAALLGEAEVPALRSMRVAWAPVATPGIEASLAPLGASAASSPPTSSGGSATGPHPYLEFVVDREGGKDRGPLAGKEVLVYSPQKTGSVSLYRTIAAYLRGRDRRFDESRRMLHNHYQRALLAHSELGGDLDAATVANRPVLADLVVHRVEQGLPLRVVSSYREPLARAISLVFQKVDRLALIDRELPLADISLEMCATWLDNELTRPVEVRHPLEELDPDFFERERFDHDEKCCYVAHPGWDVLVVVLEHADRWPDALARRFGYEGITPMDWNRAEDKELGEMYRQFKAWLRLDPALIAEVYDPEGHHGRYLRWFYTEDERLSFERLAHEQYAARS